MKQNILITGAADFMAPYIYRALRQRYPDDEADIWLLGTGDLAGINVDLSRGAVELPAAMNAVVHCDMSAPADGFAPGTALDLARNLTESLAPAPPAAMVYISSVDVYGVSQGEDIDETADCDPVTPFGQAKLDVEEYLTAWCSANGVNLAILRPAMTVGTGMGGELRRLVNRIYRAIYRHVADNEARVSVVHATTLADAISLVIGLDGVWNVTDGDNPTRHDLAEALAWRLDHKRIYTLSLKKARLLARIGDYLPVTGFTSASLRHELSTLTFSNSRLAALTGSEPEPVVSYLRTHVYDENSL